MTPLAWLGPAETLAAITAMAAVRSFAPPRRRLSSRLGPYVALARARLGTSGADRVVGELAAAGTPSPILQVLGPLFHRFVAATARWVDVADTDTVVRRLRNAGHPDRSVDAYRVRQLGWAVAGVSLGAGLGVAVFGSPGMTLLLLVCFGVPGATLERSRLDRRIAARTIRMRSEAATVALLIAVHVRSGHGPVDAVRSVTALGHGPVVDELVEALGWIGGGTPPERAYGELADLTPEPAAARLYRLLGSLSTSGGDIAPALLAVADDVRATRRDELARAAARRRTVMVLPLLVCIAPVMVLFVGAALPSLVFGP